ncbi:MAG: hypothetical protein JNM56_25120 [Planctomycetia bacterium]|nr:hypothetical protein [Planctomycetia bacterium]
MSHTLKNGFTHRPAAKRNHQRTSTTSTGKNGTKRVEGVEGKRGKPEYHWQMEAGLDKNFSRLGKLLAGLGLPLYRHPDGGLLFVEDNRPRRITTAKELAPLLIDHVRIAVIKNGKYHADRVGEPSLHSMLHSRSFLAHFPVVDDVVTTPVVLGDHTQARPGYNANGKILYLGPAIATRKSHTAIDQFLSIMDWQTEADRTNAVGALVTVPFRHHFAGGKPLVLVTATKSHAGKGTLIDFIRGKTAKAEVTYEDKDWPMQRALHEQFLQKPEIGVINFDNVRTDSSGRGKIIRTGFLESFITSDEVVLTSAAGRNKPIRTANKFVVLLNTNEGALSIDLLNRSLPIRLNPTGDLTERIATAKAKLGGDVKHEWLPAHRDQIEAELWGMIERWVKEGKPLDKAVKHPMGPWAATIGGILRIAGFKDFLANYSATRAVADPIREALGILAFHAGKKPKRAGELAKLVVMQGLAKLLLVGADPANEAACERAMGVLLSRYVGETFTATTAKQKIPYRLKKESKRWEQKGFPYFRYTFEEGVRVGIKDGEQAGVVLEEKAPASPESARTSEEDHE